MLLTGSMMVAEFIGGLLTNSLALLSDAGHMLTHAFALGTSLLAIVVAARPTTPERSFGLYRAEVLAALLNATTLVVITGAIVGEALGRLLHPVPVLTGPMLVVALVGLAVNLASAAILAGAQGGDPNVRSAFLHMVSDTLSSVAIIAGGFLLLATGWWIIDPILGLLISVLILYWVARLLRDSVHVLLESAPAHLRVGTVVDALRAEEPAIRGVHDVHLWEITAHMYALTAHLVVADLPVAGHEPLLRRTEAFLASRFGITHTVFQLEPEAAAVPLAIPVPGGPHAETTTGSGQ